MRKLALRTVAHGMDYKDVMALNLINAIITLLNTDIPEARFYAEMNNMMVEDPETFAALSPETQENAKAYFNAFAMINMLPEEFLKMTNEN